MLESSWASFNYILAVLIHIPELNLWSTSCICRLAQRRVSISASTTFHRVSSRPMPRVLVAPFGIRTSTIHTISWGISPVRQMCCSMSTRHRHSSLCGYLSDCSPGYASHHHCLKYSVLRWVCPTTLCGCRWRTTDSNSASNGISSFTLDG